MSTFKYVVTVEADSTLKADMGMAQCLGLRDTPNSAINWEPINVENAHADLIAARRAAGGDSNDSEIQALQEIAERLESIVGEPDYDEEEDE